MEPSLLEPSNKQKTVPEVKLSDTTMGEDAKTLRHCLSTVEVRNVVRSLDDARVEVIEINQDEQQQYIDAACSEAKNSKIAVRFIPGLNNTRELAQAHASGVDVARIATLCTEPASGRLLFQKAQELGMSSSGFLLFSEKTSPENLVQQAKFMSDAGCSSIYIADTSGALEAEQVHSRISLLVDELGDQAEIGFQGPTHSQYGLINSIYAMRAGAKHLDSHLISHNSTAIPLQVLAGLLHQLEINTGINIDEIALAAKSFVQKTLSRLHPKQSITEPQVHTMNHAAMEFAIRAGERYQISPHTILKTMHKHIKLRPQDHDLTDIAGLLAQSRNARYEGIELS